MSRPLVQAFQAASAEGDVRALPPSQDRLYQQIICRFDPLVEVVCDKETELENFLNDRIHGQPDIAHVEVMTRLGMFKNQFLLKRNVP